MDPTQPSVSGIDVATHYKFHLTPVADISALAVLPPPPMGPQQITKSLTLTSNTPEHTDDLAL